MGQFLALLFLMLVQLGLRSRHCVFVKGVSFIRMAWGNHTETIRESCDQVQLGARQQWAEEVGA